MAIQIDPDELLDRVQTLTEQVDALADVRARTLAQDLVTAVITMYGDGLARIMATIAGARDAGATILDELAQDGAVASLLLIHDLYPVSLQDRVLEALDTVRPYMESHGGDVRLLGLEAGVARLALEGSCNGCAASRATLELAIKQALEEHAPDLAGLEVSGVTEPEASIGGLALPMASGSAAGSAPDRASGATAGLPLLPLVQAGPTPPSGPSGPDPHGGMPAPSPGRWIALAESARPAPGGLRELDIDGSPVLFADVGDSLLAYENRCAACGETLGGGELRAGLLRCPSCEVEFDLPRAGRAAGGEPLQLRPVPLLEAGGLRVAI
jgi:Fe-S cluster biogenesis protein NfuA/nitrite reductase/ring-hydroxylating ferredoxin subunit